MRQGKMQKVALLLSFSFFLLPFSFAEAAQPSLTVGSASGQAGTTVSFPIDFNPSTASVTGLQFDLTLPASISTVSVTGGAILTSAGKLLSTNLMSGTWRFVIFGLNQNTIGAGTLATAQVMIALSAPAGTLSIPVTAVTYTDPNGQSIPAGAKTNGAVTV